MEKPSTSDLTPDSSLVPLSASGVLPSAFPFSLVPPASSSVPIGFGGESKAMVDETEEKKQEKQEKQEKPQSEAPPPPFAGFGMTLKPKKEEAPMKPQLSSPVPAPASTPASSFIPMVPSAASDPGAPIKPSSFRGFGNFGIAVVNGSNILRPAPEVSSSPNQMPTPASVEEPSGNGKEEPPIGASSSPFGTASTSLSTEIEKPIDPIMASRQRASGGRGAFTFPAPAKPDQKGRLATATITTSTSPL